jgi:hypothetical protein
VPTGPWCWECRPRRLPSRPSRSGRSHDVAYRHALRLDHLEALAPATQVALARLATRSWIGETYLAGSAALALYTGHRPVRDLDFMTQANRLTPQERRDVLGDLLAMDPETRVETARDGYFFARLAGDVALRLFYYPYPLADPEQELPTAAGSSSLRRSISA